MMFLSVIWPSFLGSREAPSRAMDSGLKSFFMASNGISSFLRKCYSDGLSDWTINVSGFLNIMFVRGEVLGSSGT
jgi:hypothetical protein